jgi:hypothetical protein
MTPTAHHIIQQRLPLSLPLLPLLLHYQHYSLITAVHETEMKQKTLQHASGLTVKALLLQSCEEEKESPGDSKERSKKTNA